MKILQPLKTEITYSFKEKRFNLFKHGLEFKVNHCLTFCIHECIVQEKEMQNVKQTDFEKSKLFSMLFSKSLLIHVFTVVT